MDEIWDGQERRETPLRVRAEQLLATTRRHPGNPTPPDALLHELEVHEIELEMQAKTTRQSQVMLEESRDKHLNLFEYAQVGYAALLMWLHKAQ